MRTLATLFAVLLAAVTACNKDQERQASQPKAAPAETAAVAPAPEAPTPIPVAAPSDTPSRAQTAALGLADCPSAVPGAITAVAIDRDAVILTVTAPAEESVVPIKNRAHRLADAARSAARGAEISPEAAARCPVVLADTAIEVADLPDGARIALKPTAAGLTVAQLEAEANRRVGALDAASGGAAGKAASSGRPAPPTGKGNSM
jgi:hypothetical protein